MNTYRVYLDGAQNSVTICADNYVISGKTIKFFREEDENKSDSILFPTPFAVFNLENISGFTKV